MKQNKHKGITLIALVITIIVLLILAGVAISTLTRDNGILTKAVQAKKDTEKAIAKERIQIEVIGSYDQSGKLDASTLISNLNKNIPEATITGEDFPIIVTLDGNVYKVDSEGVVKETIIADRTGIKVGDYINYEPDSTSQTTYSKDNLVEDITGETSNTADITRDSLKWQVLRIYADGSMDLIGSPTSQSIYFKDATGYNNGVYVMHDVCEKLYSRNGIKARSVTLDDMESWLTDAGKAAKNKYISDQVSGLSANDYIEKVNADNNTVTYKKDRSYYPNLYAKENGSGINTEEVKKDGIKATNKAELDRTTRTTTEKSYKQADNLTTTQTYYNISIDGTNYGDGAKALSNDTYYLVASRYVNCYSANASFGLRYANTDMNGVNIFYSNNEDRSSNLRLRPVVSLGSDVQVTASSTAAEETGTPHTITQY